MSMQYTKREMSALMSLLIRLRDDKILLTEENLVTVLTAAVDANVAAKAITDAEAADYRSAIDKLRQEAPEVIQDILAQRGGVRVTGDDAVRFA